MAFFFAGNWARYKLQVGVAADDPEARGNSENVLLLNASDAISK